MLNNKHKSFLIAVLGIFIAAVITMAATSSPKDMLRKDLPQPHHASATYNNAKSCSGCHTGFYANTGGGITGLLGVPATYQPGQRYSLVAIVNDPTAESWGFQLTASDDRDGPAGTFVNTNSRTQIVADSGRQFVSQSPIGTFQGTGAGVAWYLDWVAPPAGSGRVNFWLSATACNNDNRVDGDHTYNYAASSFEFRTGAPTGSILLQPDFELSGVPEVSRGSGLDLRVGIRVTGIEAVGTESFVVKTNVLLPSGRPYPFNGYLSVDTVRVAAGETGIIPFTEFVPSFAPRGNYIFEAHLEDSRGNVIETATFPFKVRP